MRIITRFNIISIVTIATFIVTGSILVQSYIDYSKAQQDNATANDLKVSVFERASLRDQYFLYHEQRIADMWESNVADSEKALRQAKQQFTDENSLNLLVEMDSNMDASKAIFRRIVSNQTSLQAKDANRVVLKELGRRLASQLLVKSSEIRDATFDLEDISEQKMAQAYTHLSFYFAVFSIVLSACVIVTLAFASRLIRKRLLTLHQGARRIADGNLDFRFILAGSDELTEVADSINHMTERLQESSTKLETELEERKATEVRLQLAASVFSHAREGITITNAEGTILEVNDTFTQITGYSRDEVLGKNPRVLKSGQHGPEFYAAMWQTIIRDGYWFGEIWNRHKDGHVYAEMLTISAVQDASGKTRNYVALFSDITQMKENQRQLEHIAHYDALTSLPNRVLLADRLQQALHHSQRHNQTAAVAYLDLDGFKTVNDKYGHDTGDALLVTVSQRIKGALREGDTLARIGGDEFVAVLIDLDDPQECEPVLSRMLQAASRPVTIDHVAHRVSVSIGVTFYPQDSADADQLMRHADQAMYNAKQEGKNRFYLFDVAQHAAMTSHRETVEHIRRAIRNGELVMYYQPKVNMRTGDVIGAEALIRWLHPERGLLPPSAFLPIIEEHQVSVELGAWVIGAVLGQLSAWHGQGFDAHVSVNVCARQLQQDNFVSTLADLLNAHPDVNPGQLELEVLETSALGDVDKVSRLMHACRDLGVTFALDDFGTGYSSLTYLKHLPVGVLKIDQSFVRDMLIDPDDLAIVQSVIGLASAFRRKVIAEGVETEEHGRLLLSLGCELAQGYEIARPMPASELIKWAANWRPDESWTARRQEPDKVHG